MNAQNLEDEIRPFIALQDPIEIKSPYNYNLDLNPKVNVLFAMDYQSVFVKQSPRINSDRLYYLSSGCQWRLHKKLRLAQQFGFGGYKHIRSSADQLNGFDLKGSFGYVKLSMGYDF